MKCTACLFTLFLTLPFTYELAAQDRKFEEDKADAFEELMSGNLTLRFYDAINGKEIPSAAVVVGESDTLMTDEEGKVRFPLPEEDGKYPFHFSANGYLTSDFEFEIMAGGLFSRRFSVSPAMDLKYIRIVLDWGAEPKDLDAHWIKENEYHISYRNMRTAEDGSATLDKDDTDGYGPETSTVKKVSKEARYRFYVHDYSNRGNKSSRNMSNAKAFVRVYGEGKLLKTFEIPRNVPGITWEVFGIENAQIVGRNVVTN